MDAIGGYFEIAERENGVFPRRDGVLLNTGRNALEYILRSLPEIKGLWVPYYTCKVVLEPINKLNIPCLFYHINSQFEIAENINLQDGQYLIVNNYFGIKDAYINELFSKYGDRLIVDCAQALFYEPQRGMKAFYSCRKFVGVADGGIAYGVYSNDIEQYSVGSCDSYHGHLFKRKMYGAEAGYAEFQSDELKLCNQGISRMSNFSEDILNHIDYSVVKQKRLINYQYLDEALASINMFTSPERISFACPMIYPLWVESGHVVRRRLIENRVYVAKYWPTLANEELSETEQEMRNSIIPLPIDQRYGKKQMDIVIDLLK